MSAVINSSVNYWLKSDTDRALAAYDKFWHQETVGRPLLDIKVKKNLSQCRQNRSRALAAVYDDVVLRQNKLPLLPLEQKLTRRQCDSSAVWHCNYVRSQLLSCEFCCESMPKGIVMLGRDITAMGCLAGGEFEFADESEFITFEKLDDFLQYKLPEYSGNLPYAQEVKSIYDAVCADVGNLGFVNPPTTADALTTMAMLMGETDFCRACAKKPRSVLEQGLKLNKLFYDFYDEIYSMLKNRGYGQAGSWFPVCYDGKFDSVRSDVSVMLSEKSFCLVALPLLVDACNYMDCSMFNLDSIELLRFLPYLIKIPKLNGIYWNLETWHNDYEVYLPTLRRLKNSGMALALPCGDLLTAEMLIKALGCNGILLEIPPFDSKDEADSFQESIEILANKCIY